MAYSELVSGVGTGFEICKTLSQAVRAAGGNDNHLRSILREKQVVEDIADRLVLATVTELFDSSFSVKDRDIRDLIEHRDCAPVGFKSIDWVESPVLGDYEGVLLVPRPGVRSIHDIEEEFKRHEIRPAGIYELLSFATQYLLGIRPGFYVFALGSRKSIVRDDMVPFIRPRPRGFKFGASRLPVDKVFRVKKPCFLGVRPR